MIEKPDREKARLEKKGEMLRPEDIAAASFSPLPSRTAATSWPCRYGRICR